MEFYSFSTRKPSKSNGQRGKQYKNEYDKKMKLKVDWKHRRLEMKRSSDLNNEM